MVHVCSKKYVSLAFLALLLANCGEDGDAVELPVGMKWAPIPAGTFQMGCSPGDPDCYGHEVPVHLVKISAFDMLETEVTEGQYLELTGAYPSAHLNGAYGTDMPVENVTWDQSTAFCEAIGGRLPTEAEWEYAARGGTATRFYCGNSYSCLDEIAWFMDNSGDQKHEVRGKTANAYGLYDMLGNVWEWTNDWYGDYEAGMQDDPEGAASGTGRVMRGCSFETAGKFLRVSVREIACPLGRYDPAYAFDNMGFRCVRDK